MCGHVFHHTDGVWFIVFMKNYMLWSKLSRFAEIKAVLAADFPWYKCSFPDLPLRNSSVVEKACVWFKYASVEAGREMKVSASIDISSYLTAQCLPGGLMGYWRTAGFVLGSKPVCLAPPLCVYCAWSHWCILCHGMQLPVWWKSCCL